MSTDGCDRESEVTFDEAREHGESQRRRLEAYLRKTFRQGAVAQAELAEINRIGAEYAARLGDQPDPWTQFRDLQSHLSRLALERYGTDEGIRAYAAYLANEANPRPVDEAER